MTRYFFVLYLECTAEYVQWAYMSLTKNRIENDHMWTKLKKPEDQELRAATKKIQQLATSEKSEKEIDEVTSKSLLTLAKADFCLMLEVQQNPNSASPTLVVKITTQKDQWDHYVFETTKRHIDPNEFWLDYIHNPSPIIQHKYCDAIDEVLPKTLTKHKSSILCPIMHDGKVIYIAILTATETKFSGNLPDRLHPILTAYSIALNAVSSSNELPLNSFAATNIPSDSNYLTSLTNTSLNGIITVNEDFRITNFNPAAETIFGTTYQDVFMSSLESLIPNRNLTYTAGEPLLFKIPNHLADKTTKHKIWRGVTGKRKDGSEFLMDISVCRSKFDETIYSTFFINDISDRIEAARELQDNLQRFKALTNLAPVGIIQVDAEWSCTYVNDTWCELSGLSKKSAQGLGWINAIHNKDAELVLEKLRSALNDNHQFTYEFRLETPKGQTIWVKANARALYQESGNVSGFLCTFSDITKHRLIEKKLRQMAEFDPLTKLANRTFFQNRLKQSLENATEGVGIILFFIDLDGFKSVNDSLGHGTGDELLKLAAQRILDCVRKKDTVARIGGDEFTVILGRGTNLNLASKIASKIVELMRKPFIVNGQEIFISTSLGIATGRKPDTDPETITKQADIALYRAKALGKNKYQFFTPELDAQAKATMFLSSGLHRAIERNEFELYYQPQINLVYGQITGLEALLRWHHPQIGEVQPDRFIPLLEETGLIEEVGQWVIKHACIQMAEWKRASLVPQDVKLSINISARQLKDPDLAPFIENTLNKYNLTPDSVIVEITESVFLENIEENQSIFSKLKHIGMEISLDDFGTGYSSLAYLKKFPIDHLKIDRSFVMDIRHDPDDAAIVQAIIALADSLNLGIIAEGVEDLKTLKILQGMNCSNYQGFYYSPPLPAKDLSKLLSGKHNKKKLASLLKSKDISLSG